MGNLPEVGNPPYLRLTPFMEEMRSKCECRSDPCSPCDYCRAVIELQDILGQYNKKLDIMRMERKISEADTPYLSIVQILELNAFYIKLLPIIRLSEEEINKARQVIDENKLAMMNEPS